MRKEGEAAANQNAKLVEELRAGRDRLQALWRRLGELEREQRDWAAHELYDDAEQILIGLRLLERLPRSAVLAARAAELQRTAEGVQESLQRLAANLRPPASLSS